jgi:alpha-tubulin suppressor-like RCC1 family protein
MVAADGTLYCWGSNRSQGLGIPDQEQAYITSPLKFILPKNPLGGPTEVHSMSSGECHNLLLTKDSPPLVFAWGYHALPGEEALPPTLLEFPGPPKIPIQVCAGAYFSVVLFNDGSLVTWGSNSEGQLGNGAVKSFDTTFYEVEGAEPFVQVAAGWEHVIALAASGNVYGWGRNEDGKLGFGDMERRLTPTLIPGLPKINKVYCGGHHTFFLTEEKKLLGCGWGSHGNFGWGPNLDDVLDPTPLPMQNIEDVACGWSHVFAFLSDGSIIRWGFNEYGQLGNGDDRDATEPAQFSLERSLEIKREVKGMHGENINSREEVRGSSEGMKIEGIIANGYQTHFITRDGGLYSAGYGNHGRLGLGSEKDKHWPKKVAGFVWEVPGGREKKWREVMRWLFLGSGDDGCPFFGIPDELLFHVVGVL